MTAARAPPRRKPASVRRRSACSAHDCIARDGSADENGSHGATPYAPGLADGELILIAGALLAAGLLASLVAGRLRVPGLLLFLFLGMAIGSDGLGCIDFSDYRLARRIGIIALALILFEGGLTSGLLEIRPVLTPALSLAVVGTIVTAVVTGFAAVWLFDLSTLDGMLLGSVLAATDGAAIFALLRGSTLKRRLATTLEGESGFNDPVAILLVLGFIEWLQHDDYGIADMAVLFVRQLGIGLAVGVVVGIAAVWVLRRVTLATAGLYPVATLAVAALAFGGADALHGSGFLAVYLAGLALGTAGVPAQQTVTSFHQGLAWVGQVAMFVALGLLVFPSHLDDVAFRGTVLALVLVFVSRPVAVAVSTLPMRFTWTERAVLAGAGLRGAVPVVLATFPVIDGRGGEHAALRRRLLRRAALDAHPGHDVRAGGPLARRHHRRAGAAASAGRGGDDQAPGRRGARVPRRRGRRGGRRARARPRAAARGGGQRHRARRRGDPAARLDRPALPAIACTSCCARSSRATCTRSSSAGARGRSGRRRARHGSWRAAGPSSRSRRSARSRSKGDVAHARAVAGTKVVAQLRVRRDVPGCLVALEDGRYAMVGPLVAVGARQLLTSWATRRLRRLPADDSERAWLQNVVGALAADLQE